MKILTYGHPVLRKKASKIKTIDKETILLSERLFKEMENNVPKGIGLAATQVGYGISLFVYEIDDDKGVVINPEILVKKGHEVAEEGCLSVPGVYGPVERALEVVVRALDIKGKKVEMHVVGLKARVFQHEIDHLNGILFTDYINDINNLSVEDGFEIPEKLLERLKVS
jgi:peptide deformylase